MAQWLPVQVQWTRTCKSEIAALICEMPIGNCQGPGPLIKVRAKKNIQINLKWALSNLPTALWLHQQALSPWCFNCSHRHSQCQKVFLTQHTAESLNLSPYQVRWIQACHWQTGQFFFATWPCSNMTHMAFLQAKSSANALPGTRGELTSLESHP